MVFSRLFRFNKGVQRTRQSFFGRISQLFDREQIDQELWDELGELLIAADVGVETTDRVISQLQDWVQHGAVTDAADLRVALRDELVASLEEPEPRPLLEKGGLNVLLVIGVNGVGKTTTIAKLAKHYRDQGWSVVLAAGDTFRAAAIDQLKIWGERANVPVIAHQPGADPGSVVFDAISAARARSADLLIVDTAGRLHTKFNLMEELKKIRRVVDRQGADRVASLLILDATTGQNGLLQAQNFAKIAGLDGVAVAKLDGTARAGVVFSIVKDLDVPLRFVGTGETIDDLAEFDSEDFVDALMRSE
ncbi:MAG: signal recognition particle-docking protein FtsY [Chloroflexi bacterium]|nr:signal recognition particle-docking protein FtsY [Chloroflexota bacterium]